MTLTKVLGTLLACVLLAAASVASAGRRSGSSVRDDQSQFLDNEQDAFAADADADTYAGPAPLTAHFTARTINPKGRVRYTWNFDDRSASSEQNPVHTFRKRGWYLVTMDAHDAAGNTYRINLQLHAWRPRDWARLLARRDMRISEHAVRELMRKRQRAAASPAAPDAASPPSP